MIQFRQAQFADYTAIAKLHADNWKRTYRGILSDHYLDNEVDGERLQLWHQRFLSPSDNQFVVVATSEDTIIGFCCVYLDDDPTFGALIDNLHVSPGLQKSGIGKKLVQAAAKHVSEHAALKKMYLWVYESNLNARIAYEKMNGETFEMTTKENPDGTTSRTCRIVWNDLSML
jgi:ribosomal protein S18 acetylase RimI-like enzyme